MPKQITSWHLQVTWTENVIAEYDTFEAAHQRAVELVREHPSASGNVYGQTGPVSVSASYYRSTYHRSQESPNT